MMPVKKVYVAIAAVTAALASSGIAKERSNLQEGYKFRGIDDIYNALSPLIARHRLCILPRILERSCEERRAVGGDTLLYVTVRAAFDFVSAEDGSKHVVETYGEAMDQADKATAKAMTAAYKYAAIQTFCIPTSGDNDADATTLRLKGVPEAEIPPDEGWEGWSLGFEDVVNSCMSNDAITLLQNRYRERLRALSKAEPKRYADVGETIKAKRAALAKPCPKKEAA